MVEPLGMGGFLFTPWTFTEILWGLEGEVIETEQLSPQLISGPLHEAEALVVYGEQAEAYVRSQLTTKAFEAIGLSALSVSYRDVDAEGIVVDFDGRPWHDKLVAACHTDLPAFERLRRAADARNNTYIVDQLLSEGGAVLEISGHPAVPDSLADSVGYSSEMRYAMIRRYSLEGGQLVLRSYNMPGSDIGSLRALHNSLGGKLAEDADELDVLAAPLPMDASLESILVRLEPSHDFSAIENERQRLEELSRPYITHFMGILRELGQELGQGQRDLAEARELHEQLERGLLTLLLVKLNPERAASKLTEEDYLWMQALLDFDPIDTMLAASDVADRNDLTFIACGGISEALLQGQNAWHGGEVKQGRCVNCQQTTQVGVASWCQVCIKGHCG